MPFEEQSSEQFPTNITGIFKILFERHNLPISIKKVYGSSLKKYILL